MIGAAVHDPVSDMDFSLGTGTEPLFHAAI
jgi:hypothetical protein